MMPRPALTSFFQAASGGRRRGVVTTERDDSWSAVFASANIGFGSTIGKSVEIDILEMRRELRDGVKRKAAGGEATVE